MNKVMIAAGSVAAVALVGVIGIGIVGGGGSGPGADPSPSATPSPTRMSTPAVSELTHGPIEPGQYFYEIDGIRFTFSVPEPGWAFDVEAGGVFQGADDSKIAIFWPGGDMSDLYRRACESLLTEFDPGPSVDDLADALASLEDFEVTTPADVIVSGYEGKRVAVTVPMDVDVNSPACLNSNYSLSKARWFQAAGQTDDMRILDVDGERQLIVTSNTPGTPADVTAQFEEMLNSLVIEPAP